MQSEIEALDGWNWEQRVEETLQRLHLDPEAVIGTLSGGTKQARGAGAGAGGQARRAAARRAHQPPGPGLHRVAGRPAGGLQGQRRAITHDRAFLDRVATRIVELDRGILRSYPGNFSQYLVLKEEQLAQEAVINAKADKLLAQEEIWIRKGVEARRTRSRGRIGRLEKLRATRAARREALGSVRLDVASGLPSGKIVAELTEVGKPTAAGHRAQLQRHHPARRQGRPDRPQRRGQDHAAQADPGRAGPDSGTGAPGRQPAGGLLSTRCATRWTWTPRWRTSSAPAASGSRSAATSASTSRATWATSCSRRRAPTRRCARSAAANATACCWRACLPAGQCAGAGRADQRPGHRHAGTAGRPAAELRRHGVPGQP
jgi:hypothetical protein